MIYFYGISIQISYSLLPIKCTKGVLPSEHNRTDNVWRGNLICSGAILCWFERLIFSQGPLFDFLDRKKQIIGFNTNLFVF